MPVKKIESIIIILFILMIFTSVKAQTEVNKLIALTKSTQWEQLSWKNKKETLIKIIEHISAQTPTDAISYTKLLTELSVTENDKITETESYKYTGVCYFYLNKKVMALLQFAKAQQLAKEIKYTKGEADALYNMGFVYYSMDKYEQALDNYTKALHVDSLANNKTGLASTLNGISIVYQKIQQYTKANITINKAYQLAVELNDTPLIAKTLHNFGEIYKSQSDFSASSDYFEKSLEIQKNNKNTTTYIQTTFALGEIYEITGRFDKAIEMYNQVIKYSENLKYRKGEAMALNGLGNIYKTKKQYRKALDNYLLSYQIMNTINDNTGIAIAADNIGNVNEQLGFLDSALNYYNISLSIKQETNKLQGLATSLDGMGMVYFKMNDYKKAIEYLESAYKKRIEQNQFAENANTLKNLGIIYSLLKNYPKAIGYITECVEISKKYKLLQFEKNSYALLANIYAETNDYRKAFEYNRQANILQDSIFNIETQKQLDEIRTKYETDKKTKENNLLKKDIELKKETILRQNIMAVTGFLTLIFTVVVALIFFKGRQKQRRANILLSNQKETIEKQAEQLSTQNKKLIELNEFKEGMTGMIVHDLKNPLNTILGNAIHPEVKQAGKQMLNMVLNILDVQKLESAQMKLIPVNFNLNKCITDALMQIKLLYERKAIQININVPDNLTVDGDYEIINRVFINLLTNAIKYTPNNGNVNVNIIYNNIIQKPGFIQIGVKDSGIGIPPEKQQAVFEKFVQVEAKNSGGVRSTGLGLTFCKLAVEAHGGIIWVESEINKGAVFYFMIPAATIELSENNSQRSEINFLTEKIKFTHEEKQYLIEFINKLCIFTVYEFSDIKKILKEIDFESTNITNWKNLVLNAVKSCNEQKYYEYLTID